MELYLRNNIMINIGIALLMYFKTCLFLFSSLLILSPVLEEKSGIIEGQSKRNNSYVSGCAVSCYRNALLRLSSEESCCKESRVHSFHLPCLLDVLKCP
jgi:hypothetical protein